jgi:hypothetical protein
LSSSICAQPVQPVAALGQRRRGAGPRQRPHPVKALPQHGEGIIRRSLDPVHLVHLANLLISFDRGMWPVPSTGGASLALEWQIIRAADSKLDPARQCFDPEPHPHGVSVENTPRANATEAMLGVLASFSASTQSSTSNELKMS